jgi:hypothetical protein
MSESRQRENPYVGPRAFTRGDRLYGRDREVRRLLNLLIAERIVLMYSPSGAGKTSLIQAALIPDLEEEGFRTWPTMRVNRELPPEETGGNEANRYVLSLILALEEGLPEEEQTPVDQLAGMTLDDYLSRRTAGEAEAFDDVIVFDQFEEILTLDPTDRDVKIEFFEQLGAMLQNRRRWALFAMREEFIAGLDPYLRPIPTRFDATFRLELLSPNAARQAMQKPASAVDVTFTEAAAGKLVDDLRTVRVLQPDGAMGKRLGLYVEPVQLQVVCRHLWDRLLPPEGSQLMEADLEVVGDVDRALADFYADCVAAIAADTGASERAIRDWIDGQLITEQGIRGQVLQGPGRSRELENRVIWRLVDAHLVRAEDRRGATWFELAHDRLIEPVRADNAAWREKHLGLLQRQAALWQREGRPVDLLLRGPALVEAERWAAHHGPELTELERDFLAACRDNLSDLGRQAAQWTREGRPEHLLLRSQALAEAETWATGHASELTDVERLFLQESRKAQKVAEREQRQNRRIRWLAVGASLAAVIALVLAGLAYISFQRADRALSQANDALRGEAGAIDELRGQLTRQNETAIAQVTGTSAARETLAADLEATVAVATAEPLSTATQEPSASPTRRGSAQAPTPTASSIISPGGTPTGTPSVPLTDTPLPPQNLAEQASMELTRVYATQTAAARCSFEPQGEFNAIWSQAQVQHTLGCPVDVNPVSSWFAEQEFDERGYMYWSQIHDLYFVVFYDNPSGEKGTWLVFENSEIPNINLSGTACKSDIPSDPAGIQPVRGFGGVWCALDSEDRQKLGYATQPEQGVSGDLLQEFENGFILRDSRGVTYALYGDRTYTMVRLIPTSIPPMPTPTKPPIPAGAQIAFVSTRRGGTSDLFVMGVDGEGPSGQFPARSIRLEPCDQSLERCFEAGWPRFKPGSHEFVFHMRGLENGRATGPYDLYRATLLADRAQVHGNLTEEYGWDQMAGTWSPEGDKIAYLSTVDNRNRVWIMYLDASGRVRDHKPLTSGDPYKDEQPAWSPTRTDEWIAVASQRLGADTNPWEIWLIDPDNGQNRRQVTRNGMRSGAAMWSPDGKRLVFTLGQEEAKDICIINKDGTGQVCHLTPWKEDLPSWSPDGNWIAFHRIVNDTYRTEIFIMRSDFSDERRLTYNQADDWGPVWVP